MLLAVVVGLGLAEAQPARAQLADAPWPTFGQDLQRTGQTPNEAPEAPTGAWTGSLASGNATAPAVGPDGHVYVVDDDGSGTFTLKQYDPADGSILDMTALTTFPEGQPVVTESSVLVTTVSGGAGSLKAFDGLLSSLIDNVLDVDLAPSGIDSLSTPTVGNGGIAYVMADVNTGDPNTLYAVDLSSGTVDWTAELGNGSTVAPPIIQDDGTILVPGGDGVVYEVSESGGVEPFYDTGLDSLSAPAIAPDGTVYVTGGGQTAPTLFSLPPDGGPENWTIPFSDAVTSPAVGPGEVVYVADRGGTVHAREADGEQRWASSVSGPLVAAPAVDENGAVYTVATELSGFTSTPVVRRHDPATGSVDWAADLGGGLPVGRGIALAADRTAYVSVSRDSDFSFLHALQPLAVQSVVPLPNRTIARTGALQFTFSEPMADLSGLADRIVVRGGQSGEVDGSVSGTGTRTLTYSPSTEFAPGEKITVSLLDSLADTRGATLDSATTYQLTAEAGPGAGRFPADSVVSTSENGARAVAAGDLDGDGDRDLVVAATEGNTVRWFENDGTGRFGDGTTIDSGLNFPRDVAVADIDGDGALDVIAAAGASESSDGDDRIRWYANDGSGSFEEDNTVISSNEVDDVRALDVGDLDGDGDVDVVSASSDNSTIAIHENQVDEENGFSSRSITGSADDPRSVAVGDFENDGDLDVVWGEYGGDDVAWARNQGDGTFGAPTTINGATSNVSDVAAMDVDRDGTLDVVGAETGEGVVAWYENTGSGFGSGFVADSLTAVESVHPADVNGDGRQDLFVASSQDTLAWVAGTENDLGGRTVFETAADSALGVTAADLDGDGTVDPVAASFTSDTVTWYPNVASLTVVGTTPVRSAPSADTTTNVTVSFSKPLDETTVDQSTVAVTSAQFGALDEADGSVAVNGDELTFEPARPFEAGEEVSVRLGASIRDVDGVPLDPAYTFGFTTQTGPESGAFVDVGAGLTGVERGSANWGDYDGDGDLDLIVTGLDGSNPTATIYENDVENENGFTAIGAGLTPVELSSSAWGDYDGDGDLDLVVTGSDGSSPTATIYENDVANGNGFSAIGAGLTGVESGSASWGDYDGDGDLDLVVVGSDGNNPTATIYENDVENENGFTAIGAGLTAIESGSASWGDYDGDGDLDLVVTGTDGSNPTATIYENDVANGNGFSAIGAGLTGVESGSASWGNYDGDGDLDLAITGSDGSDARAWIYENDVANGNGFTAIGAGLTGVEAGASAWGDYDGDGDLDLIVAGSDGSDPTATIYENDVANGNGFAAIDAGLIGTNTSSVAWGDYDGDDGLDLVVAGGDGSDPRTTVYQQAAPPRVTADPATSIGPRQATLNGTVTPGGDTTVVSVLLREVVTGDTSSAPMDTLRTDLDTAQPVSRTTPDTLRPSTEYQYRVAGENAAGVDTSAAEPFSTGNVAPTAEPDTATAIGGQAVSIPVVGNDTDVGAPGLGGTLDSASVRIEQGPSRGTARVEEEGAIRYEAETGYTGPDSLTYTVADSEGRRSAPATLQLNVVNVTLTIGAVRRGDPVSFGLTVGGEYAAGADTLYARRGGTPSYRAVPLSVADEGPPLELRARIPDSLVTPRGVDYYVVLAGAKETLTVPAGGEAVAARQPRHLPVGFETLTAPTTLASEQYRMVSVPARPSDGIRAALRAAFGPYDPGVWRAERWRPGPDGERGYESYPEIDRLRPGQGFWVTTAESEDFALSAGQTVPADSVWTTVLRPGWNQIGTPFGFAVPWDTVQAASEIAPEAIEGPIAYRDGAYRRGAARLAPWTGYFVFNARPDPDTLRIPPVGVEQTGPESRSKAPRIAADSADADDDRYTLRVEAVTDAGRADTHLGLWPGGEVGWDSHDRAQVPPIGRGVRIAAMETAAGRSTPHARSVKPPSDSVETAGPAGRGEGQSWRLRLWRPDGEGPASATLRLTDQGERPPGHERYVLDLSRDRRLSPGTTLDLDSGEARRLKVIVGTNDYAREHSEGISISELETTLRGSYPNPFEERTTIEYVLDEQEDVRLQIYNVLGQRVRTLVQGTKQAGVHRAAWNGKNRYGTPVGNGVYFYRLEAGDVTETRKAVLVR